MNGIQQAVCSMIATSLFGKKCAIPSDVDWKAVIRELQYQALGGLKVTDAPEIVQKSWNTCTFINAANTIQNLYEQGRLIQIFSSSNIPLVIIKGAAAAVYYPDPTMRSMGDIDFLVPQDSFEASVELMKRHGYVVSHREDDPNPRHIGFKKNDVSFELHHHFSYEDLDIEGYLVDGMKEIQTGIVDQHRFPMLPPLANGLVLLAHMRSHLKSGMGLRQVLDWMMYCDKVLNDDFWNREFRAAAESVGLDTLAITVTRMCQMYLGLSDRITWCSGAQEDLTSQLLDSLFTSGNFGKKRGSGGKVENVGTNIMREGLFRYLQRAGEHNWQAYRKHRWLKPFCWLYQICRYVRQGFKTGRGSKLLSDIQRSSERHEMLKALNI